MNPDYRGDIISENPYADTMTDFLQNQHNVDIPPYLLWIAFALFTVAGLLCLISPQSVWELTHWHSVDGGEPTRYYLISTRIWGGLLLALGLASLVLVFAL